MKIKNIIDKINNCPCIFFLDTEPSIMQNNVKHFNDMQIDQNVFSFISDIFKL